MAATSSNEKDLLALPMAACPMKCEKTYLFTQPLKKMAATSSNEKDLLALPLKQDGRLSSNEKRGNYLFALLRKKHFFFGMQAGS